MNINVKKYYITLAVFCGLAYSSARAQTIIDWFRPNPNAPVRAIVQQSSGRLIIGGGFGTIGGTVKHGIGCIYIDGSLDATFSDLAEADSTVTCLARQSDDKIVVGGAFETMNGQTRKHIARLEADGTLDSSFTNSVEGIGWIGPLGVYMLVIQTDGKILVGGDFTTLAGQPHNCIGRLNADGSLDTSFTATADTFVFHAAVQPDGKIILAGFFTSVNGDPRNRIARLNADGSLDASFNPNAEDGNVDAVIVQPDGKIIVAGNFTRIAGADHIRIARLNTDGSSDPTFNPGTGADGEIYRVLLQPDGKIVLGGAFTHFNGAAHNYSVRLNADGSVDATFDIGSGFNGEVWHLYQQSDGKIVAGGDFTTGNGLSRPFLLRLYSSEGKVDSELTFSTQPDEFIYAIAVQRNERILIGGYFTAVDGADHKRIARVGPDYDNVDASFTTSVDDDYVRAIIVQPDDKIIIGGYFSSINTAAHTCLARLLADGTIDPAFTSGTIAGGGIRGMALQPDGKIVIGGGFTTIDGASYKGFARLNTNGVIDSSFNPGDGVGDVNYINSVALQSDGKILVGGTFTSLGGQDINRIGRLNADGSVDTGFNPNADGEVRCITVQPDGKIMVGGFFDNMGGAAHNRIVRLDTNGVVDASFNLPGETGVGSVRSIVLHCDGKMIVSGSFTTIGGEARNYIARLNSDGSLDTSFDVTQDADNDIYAAMLQKDGKIVCGGLFEAWGGRKYLARVKTTSAALQSLSVSAPGDSVTWLRSGASPELTRCIFEYSSDNATWSELGSGTRISGGWQLVGLALPLNTNFYVRATGLYLGSYGGAGGSILDSTRLVYLTTPRVVITNVSGIVTGYYGAVNYTLSGTNNINVTGTMWWANSLGGSASFAATNPWSVTVTGLSVGANTITISGSNMVGDVASNSITIVQRRNDYMAADFDGDQKPDPACYNGTNWYEWLTTLNYNRTNHAYGLAGTFPASADFDGDGFADPAVYDNKTGKWYVWLSTYSYWQVGPLPFGIVGAAPIPADFDGDRKADFAVYAAGSWYVWFSIADYQGFGPYNIGLADAIPIAGDFDGDRKADPAIHWQGFWYAWLSSINYYYVGPVACGEAEAFPIVADFDGDGICDLATVSGSVWYAWLSTAGYQRLGPFTFTAAGWAFLPE